MMTLRLADETDAPTITDLMHHAFREYAEVLDPPSGVHNETVASVRGKMRVGHWLVAERDGQPVGCAFYEPREEYVYLGRLSVPPDYRGQGIAGALTDAVEARARAANILRVRLGTRIALPHLIAMYTRRGYRIYSYEHHAGYVEPTYVMMEKELPGPAQSPDRTD